MARVAFKFYDPDNAYTYNMEINPNDSGTPTMRNTYNYQTPTAGTNGPIISQGVRKLGRVITVGLCSLRISTTRCYCSLPVNILGISLTIWVASLPLCVNHSSQRGFLVSHTRGVMITLGTLSSLRRSNA